MALVRVRQRGVVRGGLLLLAALTAGACARGTGGTARATGSSEVLMRDEIARSGATDAFQAIRMLRPTFLATRGRTSILRRENAEPVVYVDDRLFGGVAALRDIPANQVVEVRYYGAAQAQMKWGAGHSQGAILVITGSAR